MAQMWEYQPQQGSMQLSVAEQRNVDWSLLVNARIVDGILQNRPGWEILKSPYGWTTVADPHTDGGFSYTPSGYEVLFYQNLTPLGGYLFSASNGNEYIISLMSAGSGSPYPIYSIQTTSGHILHQGILYPMYNGDYIDTKLANNRCDPIDKTYCLDRKSTRLNSSHT